MEIQIKTDFAGQMAKSAILRQLPRAFKANATDWASQTIRFIKQSYKGGNVFRRPPKEIDANLAHKVFVTGPQEATIVLGTGGYVGKNEVVYARIQDEGGTIKPKNKQWLTIPFPGVTGTAANYKSVGAFFIKSKGGNLLLVAPTYGKTSKGGYGGSGYKATGKLKALFLLKKSVYLSARHWFTGPIDQARPQLARMMSPQAVWERASTLSGTSWMGEE
jgi:hypothetical protein